MNVGVLFGAFHISFADVGGCDGRLDETILVRNPDSQFPCDARRSCGREFHCERDVASGIAGGSSALPFSDSAD